MGSTKIDPAFIIDKNYGRNEKQGGIYKQQIEPKVQIKN